MGHLTAAGDQLVAFLSARLTDDLARVWSRDADSMVTQVAALDDLLTGLGSGRLPPRHELAVLLYGYGAHPAYDPAWTQLLDQTA